jgi:hypothetical protein
VPAISPRISLSISRAVSSLYWRREDMSPSACRNCTRRGPERFTAPSSRLIPYSITMLRASSVTRSRSFAAPFVTRPNTICSAARPAR